MKLRHLIFVTGAMIAGFATYGLVEACVTSAVQERRLTRLMEMRASRYWNLFYGERAEIERRKVYEETKGMGELELLRYVSHGGLELEMAPSRWDVISRAEDTDERIRTLDAHVANAASPEERQTILRMRAELMRSVVQRAERCRETIILYRDGSPERFTGSAYDLSLPQVRLASLAAGEDYFKWRAEGGGFHRFLCWTSHEVRRESIGRPFSEVEKSMALLGAEQISTRDSQNISFHRYRLSPIGWIGRDGTKHEWYYEFTVDRREPSKATDAKPGYVLDARSGLSVEPNERYTKFANRDVYPADSVLERVLRSERVRQAAKKSPFLKRVDVSYQHDLDHNVDQHPHCFWVMIDLGASIKKNDRGIQRLHFFVPSGLDGLSDWTGRPLDPDHLPQDTLGELRYLGGSLQDE